MTILISGANGYIGQRLISVLLEQGHLVHCLVRNRRRFEVKENPDKIQVQEIDFLEVDDRDRFPGQIDVAFYLIHSLKSQGDFLQKEAKSARNFVQLIQRTECRQIIYLGAIVNESNLSPHLRSRYNVEEILRSGKIPVTTLRAGIIVGSGSASFEIIRDLVEKMPMLVAPRWIETPCQPISIRNVVQFLTGTMMKEVTYGKDFDIGGPEILTYKQMLIQYARVRKLRLSIFAFPLMTPKLSTYWLYFITSISYPLVANLVESMRVRIVCRPNDLAEELGIPLMNYREAVRLAFLRIEQNMVISSWKDAFSTFDTNPRMMDYVEAPRFGCFHDFRKCDVTSNFEQVLDRIWSIGGHTGWYYGNFLWQFRGLLDRMVGGVGLRRGRTNADKIYPGDALDFWRVLVADRLNGRLLLFAEMKLPGEAWLEFRIVHRGPGKELHQIATFRPKGLPGRLYWYSVLPFHFFLFRGMINRIRKTGND